jgi:hypothetical protein
MTRYAKRNLKYSLNENFNLLPYVEYAWGKKKFDNVQINVIIIYSGAVWLKLCTVD